MKEILNKKFESDYPTKVELCAFCSAEKMHELEKPSLDKISKGLYGVDYSEIENLPEKREKVRRKLLDEVSLKLYRKLYEELPKTETGTDHSKERSKVSIYYWNLARDTLKNNSESWIRFSPIFKAQLSNVQVASGRYLFAANTDIKRIFGYCDTHFKLVDVYGGVSLYQRVYKTLKVDKDCTYKNFERAGISRKVVNYLLKRANEEQKKQ